MPLNEKTAVLVVDIQERYFREGRPLHGARDTLIQSVLKLLKFSQECEFPIFLIKESYEADFSDAPKIYRDLKIPEVVDSDPLAQIVPELNAFIRGDNVIVKKRHSAFQDTNLRQTLEARGIEDVIICGVNTDTCVLSAVLGARMDFSVTVVSDCVASSRPDMHEIALELMTCKGQVLSLDEVLNA